MHCVEFFIGGSQTRLSDMRMPPVSGLTEVFSKRKLRDHVFEGEGKVKTESFKPETTKKIKQRKQKIKN